MRLDCRFSIAKLFDPHMLFHNLLFYSCLLGFCFAAYFHLANLSLDFLSDPSSSFRDSSLPSPANSKNLNYLPPPTNSNHHRPQLENSTYLPQPTNSNHLPPLENSTYLPTNSNFPSSPTNSNFVSPLENSTYLPQSPQANSTFPSLNLHQETISSTAVHYMTDDELFRLAAATQATVSSPGKYEGKVAFLFLTRGKLPLAPLWEKFFQGHDGLFSVYIHTSDPTFVDDTAPTSPFYGRRIPSKVVQWGENSMVEAELRLLANALLDSLNQRFVLLSESDIPLFNFTVIYNYLTNSDKSNVEVYDIPNAAGRGRYNREMLPLITKRQWRKGSQWFEMNRKMAVAVISDQTYYPVFKRRCKKRCYSDEHYVPTFAYIKFRGGNSNRTLMWTDWSRRGSHPKMFRRWYVTEELLLRLRNGNKTCEYNGRKSDVCYLFARKFESDALNRLLLFAPKVMQF